MKAEQRRDTTQHFLERGKREVIEITNKQQVRQDNLGRSVMLNFPEAMNVGRIGLNKALIEGRGLINSRHTNLTR